MVATWIIGIIVAVVILFVIYIYNSLIKLKVRVKNAWSQIDVQLKRRYDLIPNLVNAVKGYMKHEKTVLEEVTKARTSLMSGSKETQAEASNQITEALKSIFAVAENYPDLKASENFKQLQEELSGTESKIAYARQFYNDSVMAFNEAIQVFPKNMFAKMFGFKQEEFFGAEGKERENVEVKF
ncbi:LemA family protein [Candidatus Woesearchaeota archaeon]|jgi:LemA protein|nr:LemA family protein [Candidatus Woesearchaeota archaeon]MBT4110529.1 LemA family protein [Candidatus Woesearchaeota archaeon]MBT4335947.1 LemA family protein [Candidatus Woesearchaeota archaeon]MBT4469074.1 LemA family protein [Candidatus Woesearchaeota archaeon]MBT6744607.1 LemA family protein [Candidatus Woesearchaeota archaeon]